MKKNGGAKKRRSQKLEEPKNGGAKKKEETNSSESWLRIWKTQEDTKVHIPPPPPMMLARKFQPNRERGQLKGPDWIRQPTEANSPCGVASKGGATDKTGRKLTARRLNGEGDIWEGKSHDQIHRNYLGGLI